jgi:signal transduction histidine kinase
VKILLISFSDEQCRNSRALLDAEAPQASQLLCVRDVPAAIETLKLGPADAVLLDLGPSADAGLELLDQLRRRLPAMPVVALATAAERPDEVAASAVQRGAQDALTAAELNPTLLRRALRYAIERKQAEEQIALSRKMESIGQLAAGIAHEINTPVQYIGDSVHFLRDCYRDLLRLLETYHALRQSVSQGHGDPILARQCEEIEQEADLDFLRAEVPRAFQRTFDGVERVTHVVRAMKEFSYPNRKEKVAAHLNQAIQDALTVARNEYKYVADVKTDCAELPPVYCHIGDINQVLLNLIVNAAHAISQVVGETGSRGLIRVTTRREGDQVAVSISDNGCGIPQDLRARIFDPFFTTKRFGKGTGQGLAIAHAIIVDKHGGSLNLESEPGRGSTFVIRLPINGTALGRPQEAA